MHRLHFWTTAFFGWLFILYNIERIHEPINLASFIYVLSALAALVFLLFPWFQKAPLQWSLLAIVPSVLPLKWCFGYSVGGNALPITVTELVVVSLTVILARQLGFCLEEVRSATISALAMHLRDNSTPFESAQEQLYREVRRARTFNRPLSLLAISPAIKADPNSLDRFSKEILHEAVDRFARMRFAKVLTECTRDSDILTYDNGYFVALLPETDRRMATEIIESLRSASQQELELDVKFGLSVFPDDEVTLVRLLERATAHLSNGNGHDTEYDGQVKSDQTPKPHNGSHRKARHPSTVSSPTA